MFHTVDVPRVRFVHILEVPHPRCPHVIRKFMTSTKSGTIVLLPLIEERTLELDAQVFERYI